MCSGVAVGDGCRGNLTADNIMFVIVNYDDLQARQKSYNADCERLKAEYEKDIDKMIFGNKEK